MIVCGHLINIELNRCLSGSVSTASGRTSSTANREATLHVSGMNQIVHSVEVSSASRAFDLLHLHLYAVSVFLV